MPSTKVLKVHMTVDSKILCGAKIAPSLTDDATLVTCANCVKLFPSLKTVVQTPVEESFTQKFDQKLLTSTTPRLAVDMSAKAAEVDKASYKAIDELVYLDPFKIHIRPGWNVRTDFSKVAELADNIAVNGLLHPLTVIERTIDKVLYYILVDGECRLQAIRTLATDGTLIMKAVPCIINNHLRNEADYIFAAILSGQGTPLSEKDEANAYLRLEKMGVDEKEIAQRSGHSVAFIKSRLELLEAEPSLLRKLDEKTVSVTEVLKIIRMAERHQIDQEKAYTLVLGKKLDLRTAEGRAEKARLEMEDTAKKQKEMDEAAKALEAKTAREKKIAERDAAKKLQEAKEAGIAIGQNMAPTATPTATATATATPTATPTAPPQGKHKDVPNDPWAAKKNAGQSTSEYENPVTRLATHMAFTLSNTDYTLTMVMRWLVNTYGTVECSEALNTACTERKLAESKVIAPPLPPAKVRMPDVPILGKIGSAQQALADLPPTVPQGAHGKGTVASVPDSTSKASMGNPHKA